MEKHLKNRTMLMPVLEEYTKSNNIEYDFVLMVEYCNGSMFKEKNIKGERLFLRMIDTNNNTLQFEEINQQGINGIVLHEEHLISIAKRLIRQQRLKELGI